MSLCVRSVASGLGSFGARRPLPPQQPDGTEGVQRIVEHVRPAQRVLHRRPPCRRVPAARAVAAVVGTVLVRARRHRSQRRHQPVRLVVSNHEPEQVSLDVKESSLSVSTAGQGPPRLPGPGGSSFYSKITSTLVYVAFLTL